MRSLPSPACKNPPEIPVFLTGEDMEGKTSGRKRERMADVETLPTQRKAEAAEHSTWETHRVHCPEQRPPALGNPKRA